MAGAGLIKFGELFEQSYEQMAAGAFQAAVANVDRGVEPEQIDAVFVATQRGTLWGQEGIGGNTVPSAIGLAGVPCTRIENACPSGSDAFRVGAMAVASGVHDVVLVIGVEKMRDKSTEEGLLSRAAAGHPILTRGETAPVLFAPFATRHMNDYGTTREMLASVAVKNHHNGARDPYAHFQNEITIENVIDSPPVCHPLHLLDCCPQTDGAAATILVNADRAAEFTDKPVYVAGFGVATDHPYLHEKTSFVGLQATVGASQRDIRKLVLGDGFRLIAQRTDVFSGVAVCLALTATAALIRAGSASCSRITCPAFSPSRVSYQCGRRVTKSCIAALPGCHVPYAMFRASVVSKTCGCWLTTNNYSCRHRMLIVRSSVLPMVIRPVVGS